MDDSAFDAREHFAQPPNVEETGRGIRPRGTQKDVIGLVAAEHVIDQVGRDRHLTARFLLAGETALDQPRDDGAGAEGTLHQCRFGEPRLEIVAEHVFVEQGRKRKLAATKRMRKIAKPPTRQRKYDGIEAKRVMTPA